MTARWLSSPPQRHFGMTLVTTARQNADTCAVGQAMSVKHPSSAVPSLLSAARFFLLLTAPADRIAVHFRCGPCLFHSGFDERGSIYIISTQLDVFVLKTYLDWTVVAQQLNVRTPLVEYTQFIDQRRNITSQSLRHTQFPLRYLVELIDLIAQVSAHALVYLFFAQCIILERHCGLA